MDRLPSGEDLVVERRTKKKTKKKTKARKAFVVDEAALAAMPTVAIDEPPPKASPSAESNPGQEQASEEPPSRALGGLLGSLLSRPQEEATVVNEQQDDALRKTLPGLLLASNVGMEGEEDEEDEQEETMIPQPSQPSGGEEGDSLDDASDVGAEIEPLTNVTSSTPIVPNANGSKRQSWNFGEALKSAWQSTGEKLFDKSDASMSVKNAELLARPQSDREAELQHCNFVVRTMLVDHVANAYAAIANNLSSVSDGLTRHLALLVQSRSDFSSATESLAKIDSELQAMKEFSI